MDKKNSKTLLKNILKIILLLFSKFEDTDEGIFI